MLFLAALSALIFTACNKGKTDDVTTDAVRVEVTGQISGALTKCLSVRYEIKDFDGKIHSGMLNNEFKGTNLEFNVKACRDAEPLPIDDFPSFLSLITNSINTFFGDTWICRVTVRNQGFDLETVKP